MKPTREEVREKIWEGLRALSKEFYLDADPAAKGPLGLTEAQSRVMTAWGRLVWIAGGVMKAHTKFLKQIGKRKRLRRMKADEYFAEAHRYHDLNALRGAPTKLKAAIATKLADLDDEIANLENEEGELKALHTYLDYVLEQAKATKEVLRQQTDVLRDHRLMDRGEMDESFK